MARTYANPGFPVFPRDGVDMLWVRHGRSEDWQEGAEMARTADGHGDPPLSDEGHVQAAALARRLEGVRIDAVYVSPLRRTHQTAAPLLRRLGIEATEVAGLREVYLGEWEGGEYRRHLAEGHPLLAQVFAQRRWDVIPGAEPQAEFRDRVRGAVRTIAADNPGRRVVVIAHGGVIDMVLALALGLDDRALVFGVDQSSVSRVVAIGDHLRVRFVNDTSHLGDQVDRWVLESDEGTL